MRCLDREPLVKLYVISACHSCKASCLAEIRPLRSSDFFNRIGRKPSFANIRKRPKRDVQPRLTCPYSDCSPLIRITWETELLVR